jgi:glyceraldehyde-3-phosphate dehydrogenase/erythrose-4-phosphate dehydrogenase
MTARVAINGFGRVGRLVQEAADAILRILKDNSLKEKLGKAAPCRTIF